MTIHLPKDIETSIEAAVRGGLFASVDEAVAEAWQSLQRARNLPQSKPVTAEASPDPLLGCMRDDAELMDEIVAEAYRKRREEPWREFDL